MEDIMVSKSLRPTKEAGVWLGLGGLTLAVVLPIHGPTHADLAVQMSHIADGHGRWAIVHWVAAVALVLLAGAGFFFFVETLIGRRREAPAGAWLLFAMGSFLTIGTAIVEATAISAAANKDDLESFVVWWQFASGLGNGFMVVAIATAIIAWTTSMADAPPIPSWLCWIGAAAAIISAVGWTLGQHFRVDIGGPIWFVGTLATALWLSWFGFKSREIHVE